MHLNVSPKEYHNSSRFHKKSSLHTSFFLLINFVDSKKKKWPFLGGKKKSIRRQEKKSLFSQYKIKNI
jgi:hypothetical protein